MAKEKKNLSTIQEVKPDVNESDYSDDSDYDDENDELEEEDEEEEEDDNDEENDDDDEKEDDEMMDNIDDDDLVQNNTNNNRKKSSVTVDDNMDILDLDESSAQLEDNESINNDDLEDLEEDDEYSEDYQKFENYSVLENLENLHPEIRSANMDEIKTLSKVVRNENNMIIDPFHTTAPFLTKYEKARVIGTRAEQIERGAPPFIKDLPEMIIHSRTIALKEFEKGLIPFIIARPLPNKGVEYWKLQDLEII
jgi:DNA-directed RNA polymerase I, II, and III subunit RPABC2